MWTIRAESLKRAQGFNLLLLFDSAGFTEGNWQLDSYVSLEQVLQMISQGRVDGDMALLLAVKKSLEIIKNPQRRWLCIFFFTNHKSSQHVVN